MSLTERKGKSTHRRSWARSHGGECAVEHLEERTSISVVGAHQFEVADGEFVETHEAFFFDACDARDVVGMVVLRFGRDRSRWLRLQ